MQSPLRKSVVDRMTAEPEREQLRSSQDPVLPPSKSPSGP